MDPAQTLRHAFIVVREGGREGGREGVEREGEEGGRERGRERREGEKEGGREGGWLNTRPPNIGVFSIISYLTCLIVLSPSLPSGAKLHLSGSKIRCIEETGRNYTLEEGASDVPPDITTYYHHTQQVAPPTTAHQPTH